MKDFILRTIDPFIRIPTIGFDISEGSAKYLAFGANNSNVIAAWGEIEIPQGLIEQGEIKQEKELGEVFRTWHEKQSRRIRSAYVVASVPEEKSFVRVIQLPRIQKENIAQAIRWELEANVPIPYAELVYDYEIIQPIEDHLNHIDIVITAFPKSIIESYVRVLKNAGFKIAVLELESQAIIRSCIPRFRSPKAHIVVDMGKNRTSFTIFSGGAIRFTTTIPIGGKVLEENIMKTLNVDQNEALRLKKEVGLDKSKEKEGVFSALIPALSALSDEFRRLIAFYHDYAAHTHGAEQVVSQILLSGGDANLLGLSTYLASALKIPVNKADPFATISDKRFSSPLPPRQALAFATTIGLALRNVSFRFSQE